MIERVSSFVVLFLIVIFNLSGFALLAFRNVQIDYVAIMLGIILSAILIFQYNVLTLFFYGMDKYLIIIMNFLVDVGIMVLYRLNPEMAFKQLLFFGIGMLVMVLAIIVTKAVTKLDRGKLVIMILSLALLCVGFLFGKELNGAKNWIVIAGFSVQPSEIIKISLIIVLASYFSLAKKKRELLPVLAFVAICMMILLVQKDLGAVLLYFGTTIIIYYICTTDIITTLLGLGAGAVGAVVAYNMFSHVRIRVAIWLNPWIDENKTTGYQIVQGLIAIASGGFLGVGLTRGMPSVIPVRYSDYIFAVICEEFGVIFGMAILAFYIVLIIRGAVIARYAKTKFHMILAFACTTMITLQGFIIIGGIIKLIPLTGITLPFISYGGSSLLTCMAIMGILIGVSARNSDNSMLIEEDVDEQH